MRPRPGCFGPIKCHSLCIWLILLVLSLAYLENRHHVVAGSATGLSVINFPLSFIGGGEKISASTLSACPSDQNWGHPKSSLHSSFPSKKFCNVLPCLTYRTERVACAVPIPLPLHLLHDLQHNLSWPRIASLPQDVWDCCCDPR